MTSLQNDKFVYFNYLYVIDNDFFGYMYRLTKEERKKLNAKLIYKRKNL
jgi:hypothetical protein